MSPKQSKKTPKKPPLEAATAGVGSTLDALDANIIAHLREDPRVSNKKLAQTLDVAEVTIASRLRSLSERRLLKVTAQRDVRALGFEMVSHMDVYVRGKPVMDVAHQLAELDQVNGVAIFAGEPQIALQVHARDRVDLVHLIETRIAKVPGIVSIETAVALEIIKFNSELGVLASE